MSAEPFSIHWAHTPQEVEEVQRLRYRVFAEELGVTLRGQDGIDCDRFDEHSRHLYVRNQLSGEVMGTYRVITAEVARDIGWYTAQEFDISAVLASGKNILEVGRACVHKDHRNGSVVLMLWKAILQYAQQNGVDFIMGCTSVGNNRRSPAVNDVRNELVKVGAFSDRFSIQPLYPFTDQMQVAVDADVKVAIPALFKGYLRLGGKFCGEPTYDADFQCADFFTLMPMDSLSPKYARHFGLR